MAKLLLLTALVAISGLYAAQAQVLCTNGACSGGLACVNGFCVAGPNPTPCGVSLFCTNGLLCVAGICVLGGSGTGDPILKGFDGREWEFLGQPGRNYALYSDADHAVNMALFKGVMYDHEGTYIGGIGFQYKNEKFAVQLVGNDLKLNMEGDDISIDENSAEGYRKFGLRDNSVSVEWSAHEPDFGRAVTFRTGTLEMRVWAVPAGGLDAGGKAMPAYLNFRTALLASPPGDEAQGLVGETLMAASPTAESLTPVDDRSFHGQGVEADYEVQSLFDTDFKFSAFGKTKAAVARRALIEGSSPFAGISFPLIAGNSV